jgi:hypothetical protein
MLTQQMKGLHLKRPENMGYQSGADRMPLKSVEMAITHQCGLHFLTSTSPNNHHDTTYLIRSWIDLHTGINPLARNHQTKSIK